MRVPANSCAEYRGESVMLGAEMGNDAESGSLALGTFEPIGEMARRLIVPETMMRHRNGLLPFLFCAGLASVSNATPAPPSLPGNWNLSFDDEFNALNSKMWQQSIWGITNPPGEGGRAKHQRGQGEQRSATAYGQRHAARWEKLDDGAGRYGTGGRVRDGGVFLSIWLRGGEH